MADELNVVELEDGGRMVELFKDESFGQLTLRVVAPGTAAGRHLHRERNEWWVVAGGEASIRLELPDGTRELHNVSGSNPRVVRVPAGTGHEIANVGEDEILLVFHADRIYDPDRPDKEDWSW